MSESRIEVKPGWSSTGDALLTLSEWTPREDEPLQFDVKEIASYQLRYSEGEVMLIKGDEIVYSELLMEGAS